MPGTPIEVEEEVGAKRASPGSSIARLVSSGRTAELAHEALIAAHERYVVVAGGGPGIARQISPDPCGRLGPRRRWHRFRRAIGHHRARPQADDRS
jgi:hypothetical protein